MSADTRGSDYGEADPVSVNVAACYALCSASQVELGAVVYLL